MAKSNRLTIEEENFIKENALQMTIGEIATSLGRSYSIVQKTMKLLGINAYHMWTEEEDAILLVNYGRVPTSQIAALLGIDESCIYNRIRRLKKYGKIIPTRKRHLNNHSTE